MRESLTILAIALIVVLTAALVGPYFVDWSAHRGAIESRLSTLLGARVTVGGPIDVKLLPRPIFRLADVTVASAAPHAPSASAERLDVELALTALLRGEFVFVDADLTAPRLTLTMDGDGAVMLPRFQATDPDHVSLSHVSVRDGAVDLLGPDGHSVVTVAGLSGDGEAESLAGPFRFAGEADGPRGPLAFRLATGALDGGKLRVKGSLEPGDGVPRAEGEGVLTLEARAGGASRLRFEGSFAAADSAALPGAGTARLPWRVAGRLAADAAGLGLDQVELRAGLDGRALALSGGGRVTLGGKPQASLTLKARQADLSRLAVTPGAAANEAGTAAGTQAVVAGLRALLAQPDLLSGLPLPVTVAATIDAVTLGQLTLSDFAGQLALRPGAPLGARLAIAAPDGSHLTLDGTVETGPAAVFKGHVDAATGDLGRLADSLAPDLPALAQALRQTVPATAVAVAGQVDLSGIGFAAHDVELALDRSHFAGTVTLTRAVGEDRARLFADLTSDALDLDALPAWRDTALSAADLDLAVSLTARAVRLAQTDTGGVSAGRATLQLSRKGEAVTLDRLLLADVGGATADLTGHSDGRTAHVEGRLDARRLGDLLGLVQRLAPTGAGAALLARADALSPALLKVAADATLAGATASLGRVSAEGTVAGTGLVFRLAPLAEAGPARYDMALQLEAPEAGALLRQFGIATLASTAIGKGRVEADARLDAGLHALGGGLAATLGDTTLTFRGQREGGGTGGAPDGLSGHATAKGANLAPLLRAALLATPEAGAVWPADAAADVALAGGRLTASHLAGHVLGTAATGSLAYVLPAAGPALVLPDAGAPPAPPALTGSLTLDRVPFAALASLALGPLPPARAGALWPEAPFAPGLATLPHGALALAVGSMPLPGGAAASEARLTLKLEPGAVTLSDVSSRLGEGRLGGTLSLRRNAGAASLSGHLDWSGVPSASPSFGGRTRGALDLAGTGDSVATLVASLAGSGTVGVEEARLPRLDAGALARAIAAPGDASGTIDDAAIRQALAADLDKGALALGTVSTPATVAAGVLRADAATVTTPAARTTVSGSLDLRSLLLALGATVVLPDPPRDWVGSPPQVTVSWRGPFAAPAREVDATALVNGLAARAIARDQARIEAFQDDIRERAFFARRLRQIEAEQQAARDKAAGEAQMQKLLQSIAPAPALAPAIPAPPARPGTTRPGPARAPLDLSPRTLVTP